MPDHFINAERHAPRLGRGQDHDNEIGGWSSRPHERGPFVQAVGSNVGPDNAATKFAQQEGTMSARNVRQSEWRVVQAIGAWPSSRLASR